MSLEHKALSITLAHIAASSYGLIFPSSVKDEVFCLLPLIDGSFEGCIFRPNDLVECSTFTRQLPFLNNFSDTFGEESKLFSSIAPTLYFVQSDRESYILQLRISAAILYGNFRLKTRNYRLSAYSVLTFLQWDPFRILLWLDVSLFWFTLCLAWFMQFCLCCRLGCCRFYFLCMAVLVVGVLIMEWPMFYLFRHMDDTWCRLDWGQFYNATFRRQ
uniref:Uncharacterized protein n=1 Tax=Romanomermis culicivorax TaxID=13658 RepID=A0A915IVM5_ROMCU